jgi:hypothetical protein
MKPPFRKSVTFARAWASIPRFGNVTNGEGRMIFAGSLSCRSLQNIRDFALGKVIHQGFHPLRTLFALFVSLVPLERYGTNGF